MAARSKACVCGCSPAEIMGSNPTGGMDVCCECCVLSGRGLCDGLITRPEETYRLWCVVACAVETSWMRRPDPLGLSHQNKNYKKRNISLSRVERFQIFHVIDCGKAQFRSNVLPSEKLVSIYQNTRCHNAEDHGINKPNAILNHTFVIRSIWNESNTYLRYSSV